MHPEERSVTCPYCWQIISVELDVSIDSQSFIEDCQVCCQLIEFSYTALEGEVQTFEYKRAQ